MRKNAVDFTRDRAVSSFQKEWTWFHSSLVRYAVDSGMSLIAPTVSRFVECPLDMTAIPRLFGRGQLVRKVPVDSPRWLV